MLYQTRFLIALLCTLVIEVPILFVLIRYGFKLKEIRTAEILFVGSIASILTLPYLWFVLPPYADSRSYLLVAEAIAFIAEAIIYNRLLYIRIDVSLILSLAANMASFLAGFLIF